MTGEPAARKCADGGSAEETSAGGRSLRVFETGNPAVLMVIENKAKGRAEYAIERDEGLVASESSRERPVLG
jgi:hypothetical protein